MRKCALITGSSRGIGRAIATQLAREGWPVCINYIQHREAAEDLVRQLRSEGREAIAVQADVADRQAVNAMVSAAAEQLGPVELLVNNAGIAEQGLFQDVTDEKWDRHIGVNLGGARNTIQAVLPHMLHEKRGCIVNISSMWGLRGASCEVTYACTKAALIALTRSLALELAPSHIRVNCVAPGVIHTDMVEALGQETMDGLAEQTPLGRLGTPEDIAYAVSFFASEKASFITGQVLTAAGGFIVCPKTTKSGSLQSDPLLFLLSAPFRQGEAVHHHAAKTGHETAAAGSQYHIRILSLPVQGEEIGDAKGIAVVLLAQHTAVHAENAHIAVPEGIAIHIDHRTVLDERLHGVALDPHGILGVPGNIARHRDEIVVLPRYRRGKACRRRAAVQRDQPRLFLLRQGLLNIVPIGTESRRHRAHRFPPDGGQAAVLIQQEPFLMGQNKFAAAETVPIQIIGIHLQAIKQPQHHVLLRKTDARFIIADGRPGNPQCFRKLCPGDPQFFPTGA